MSRQTPKKLVVTPQSESEPKSSRPFGNRLVVTPEESSSGGSSTPPDMGNPVSYIPPPVVPSIPLPPPSGMEENPSSMKSSMPSPSLKTESHQSLPSPSADGMPELHPVYGYGCPPVIEFAANAWAPQRFAATYGHRAAALLEQWPELSGENRARLETLRDHPEEQVTEEMISRFAGDLYETFTGALLETPALSWEQMLDAVDVDTATLVNAWRKVAERAAGVVSRG